MLTNISTVPWSKTKIYSYCNAQWKKKWIKFSKITFFLTCLLCVCVGAHLFISSFWPQYGWDEAILLKKKNHIISALKNS